MGFGLLQKRRVGTISAYPKAHFFTGINPERIIRRKVKHMARKQTLLTSVLFLSILAFVSPARASVLYTDFTSFMTDAGALTTIDFEENGPATFTAYGSPGVAAFSGVTFNSA